MPAGLHFDTPLPESEASIQSEENNITHGVNFINILRATSSFCANILVPKYYKAKP